jgi:hypothetical protein
VVLAAGAGEPPLVRRALELERELDFDRSSIQEVGRLLHVHNLMDDLTPGFEGGRTGPCGLHPGSASAAEGPDPVREFWLNHPRMAAIELLTPSKTAAILATRVL